MHSFGKLEQEKYSSIYPCSYLAFATESITMLYVHLQVFVLVSIKPVMAHTVEDWWLRRESDANQGDHY